MGTRENFIRERVDEVKTELKKVKPESNGSDITKKNLPVENFIQNGDLLNDEILNKAKIVEVDDNKIQRKNDTRNF